MYEKHSKHWDVVVKHKMPPIIANSKDGHVQKYKYLETNGQILSQEMLMCNMKALRHELNINKLWPMLIFFKDGSNIKVKVLVQIERYYPMECMCEICKLALTRNVQVFKKSSKL